MRTPDLGDVILDGLAKTGEAEAFRDRWLATARPEQVTPPGDWGTWLILAGRGWGKTRTGAEDVAYFALANAGARIALVAATFSDGKLVMCEGESGILSVLPREMIEVWNRSSGELVLTNGSKFQVFSAEEPERLRGPQHHRAWCDELGAWKYLQNTWDQLQFGLRLGENPQVVVTTTPKPRPLIRKLRDAPSTHLTVGSTFDNAANLPKAALDALRSRYEGTRLGRQELSAELLEDVQGALWTRAMLDAAAIETGPANFQRVVVGVDPSGSITGDKCGIVAAALGLDGRGYILEDASVQASPDGWAREVARLYHKHRADRVVAERNFGGEMVRSVLQAAAPNLPLTLVTASRGKSVRAEPVAALYEQGRISHLPGLAELEDQLCLMTGAGFEGQGSPDRVDALVWALTDLMLTEIPSMGLFEFYREEAEGRPAPVASAATVALRTPPGVSHVTGMAAQLYSVHEGLVRVAAEDVAGLCRAGFERV